MSYSLKDRRVLITGASRGLGAMIAQKFAAEGCHIAINYLSSADLASEVSQRLEHNYSVKTCLIQGDMSKVPDCQRVVRESIEKLGGLDIIISNAGNTKIAPFEDLYALEEEDWDHAWNVLTKSNVFLLREALPTFNSNPSGGVFLITSSVGGLVTAGSSMAYSVTRAAGLHLMQCLAATQGPKVRVNAVAPGLMITSRAEMLGDERIKAIEEMAVLKRLTVTEDTADTYVWAAKNGSLTGERIRVDAGLYIR